MIDTETTLGLPLVHHFVQHRVFDLRPFVSVQVAAAHSDLQWRTGAYVG
jgi:hypothetical protein